MLLEDLKVGTNIKIEAHKTNKKAILDGIVVGKKGAQLVVFMQSNNADIEIKKMIQ